ncbi:hypothetical protein [uncultured Draconibacterium sp.]|uniref:hypothetical protein n=1 Tax=uncultured Draconibacterium sp. TaxID=1573823 RepID=UPI0029C79A64|nr:hypothetical protein [uncultured Draconibacterium sp.]
MTAKKKSEDKKRPGRKTDFKQEYIEEAHNYALLGATDAEMSDFFGVSERTFNTWKKKHPEFLQSIKKGKSRADAQVASKLFNRATGYEFEEVSIEKKGRKIVSKRTTTKHIPSDTTAGIFWLKNRQPDLWRDKQVTELTGDVTLKSELESLTDEQLEEIINGDELETSDDDKA